MQCGSIGGRGKQEPCMVRKRPELRHAVPQALLPLTLRHHLDSAPPHWRFALRAKAMLLSNRSYRTLCVRPHGTVNRFASAPCGQKLRFCPIPLRTLGGFVHRTWQPHFLMRLSRGVPVVLDFATHREPTTQPHTEKQYANSDRHHLSRQLRGLSLQHGKGDPENGQSTEKRQYPCFVCFPHHSVVRKAVRSGPTRPDLNCMKQRVKNDQ